VTLFFYEIPFWHGYTTLFFLLFLFIDGAFVAGQVLKIPKGGWFSLVMAFFYFLMMVSWYAGSSAVSKYLTQEQASKLLFSEFEMRRKKKSPISLQDDWIFNEYKIKNYPTNFGKRSKLSKIPRMGIFLKELDEMNRKEIERNPDLDKLSLPSSLVTLVDSLYVVPEIIVFMEIRTAWIPDVALLDKIIQYYAYSDTIFYITAEIGYADKHRSATEILQYCMNQYGLPRFHQHHTNYFLDQEQVTVVTPAKKLPFLILYNIYSILKRIFPNRPKSIEIPPERVVEVATQVKLQ